MTDVKADLIRLAAIAAASKALAAEKDLITERVADALKAKGTKTVATTVDGESLKGTLVEAERVTIDPDALKKALSAKQWAKVTSQALDKEKLEAAVTIGEVDENVVAACSEVKSNKPSIRISGKVPDKDLPAYGIEDGELVITDERGLLKPAMRNRKIKAVKPQ